VLRYAQLYFLMNEILSEKETYIYQAILHPQGAQNTVGSAKALLG